MSFAAGLRESLQIRKNQVPAEFTNGDDLEEVLNRHLLTVEALAEGELITSILLLGADGKRLSHGAGPRLPHSYRDAVDGTEIGPRAGSCGTAAYLGRPVYVSDIAADPLWEDFRHLALPHGLRSCWSTPIRASDGIVIGTFAIYRRTVGHPTLEEIESIEMITEHVAQAIMLSRKIQALERPREAPGLKLVSDGESIFEAPADRRSRLLSLVRRLQSKSDALDRIADRTEAGEEAQNLKAAARLSRDLISILRCEIDEMNRDPFA